MHLPSLKTCSLAAALAVSLTLTACSKTPAKASAKDIKLAGASEVIGHLEKGHYEPMMAELTKIKTSITPEQADEYRKLLDRVKADMVTAMATNEAAVKAYQVLRFMETGR